MAPRRERERRIREFMAAPPFGRRNMPLEDVCLFDIALTHDSYANEEATRNNETLSYERLEFLGDAVMEMIVCEHIYSNTKFNEGMMTEIKNDIVCNKNISLRVTEAGIDIDNALHVGEGHKQKRTGNNLIEDNMRADAFEAILGAVYLLYGIDEARRIVHEILIK